MQPISNIPDRSDRKRVIIVGGGFAGLKAARKLKDKYFQVVLLDRNNYHLFQPLLYQVATSGIEPSAISFPLRTVFRNRDDFHIRVCEVKKVVPEEKKIYTSVGYITYDYLIISTGCSTNFFGNDSLAERTMLLKTTPEALFNRNQIIASFEKALSITNLEELKRKLTFIIVGGGATGIELAGALAEMRKFILPCDYPDLDISNMRIILMDGANRLLNNFSEQTSAKVKESLEKLGVEIHLNSIVTDYKDHILSVKDGATFETENVFWVGGVKANSLDGIEKERYGKGGRLLVDEYNRVQGYEDIFALGDTALMVTEKYPNGHPQVVQPAIQQARNLAKNMERWVKGEQAKKFEYKNKGNMATIGRNNAVVEIKDFRMSGFFAWAMWLFVHLMNILGVKNKIFIFFDWMWSYMTYSQSLRLLIVPEVKAEKKDPIQMQEEKAKNLEPAHIE